MIKAIKVAEENLHKIYKAMPELKENPMSLSEHLELGTSYFIVSETAAAKFGRFYTAWNFKYQFYIIGVDTGKDFVLVELQGQ